MNNKQQAAKVGEGGLHTFWEYCRGSPDSETRRLGLKAKTFGAIYWDRIMFPRSLTK